MAGPTEARERIVGGEVASIYNWPFLVAIVERENPDARHGLICGGALIQKKIVITAAHCADNWRPKNLSVISNRYNLLSKKGKRINVSKIRINPNYNRSNYSGDLAIIQLSRPLPGPYALPSSQLPEIGVFEVAGWGWQGFSYPAKLRSTRVDMLNQEVCLEFYSNSLIKETMFCAGGDGRESCSKDSGGPFIQRNGTRTIIYGVVSWGYIDCYESPTVYARLNLSWINRAIESL